jgi:hypothetical protein
MKRQIFILFIVLLTTFPAFAKQGSKALFNGSDLRNWDKNVGTALKGFDDLYQKATPDKVFSVVDVNGEKLIYISGEVNGSLATKDTFQNYHLRLVFKWGEKFYTTRNSGLIYYSFGSFGAAMGTWMAGIEHQLQHGNMGDTYLMANTTCETASEKKTNYSFSFSPGAKLNRFGQKDKGGSIKKLMDAEKPVGEWNTIDLYCFGQTSVHVVNGKTVIVNTNCGTYSQDSIKPLTSGKIQIQSEGGDLYIKSITIEPIRKLPKKL